VTGISESCSVCGGEFPVQFRYQMEERDGAFSFYCSQKCLEKSQRGETGDGSTAVTCDACAKRFQPDLVSQVLYTGGRRRYACSLGCRAQLVQEAKGVRLGDLAAPSPIPPERAAEGSMAVIGLASAPKAAPAPAKAEPAVAVPLIPASARKPIVSAGAPSAKTAPPATGKREKITPSQPPKEIAATPRYLAIFNHKGGTGKTTTAVSVASGLASRGKRVLLVDTDAQGNVGVSLGAASERSLYHVLVMGLAVSEAVRTVRPNLDLLPSNETLAAAELYLAGRQNRDRVLDARLSSAAVNYDYVVIDCSPSLSLMNQNALCFADSVLVPVACDYLSLVGVRQVIKTVKSVNSLLHHPVQIWGVLPTFFDARAKICHEAVNTLKSHFGERCLPPIRAAIKVKEAPAQGQTIFEYAAGTTAADDYGVVVDRIIAAREQAAGRTGAGPVSSAPPAEVEFTLPRSSAVASA
jgi:chromosome partitioning protein